MDEEDFIGDGDFISNIEDRHHDETFVQGNIEEGGRQVTDKCTEPIRSYDHPESTRDGSNDERASACYKDRDFHG